MGLFLLSCLKGTGVLCRALHSTSEMLGRFVLLLGLTNCVLAGGYGAAGGSQATVGTGGCGSGEQGSCCSGADCPAEAPVCSEYGFCQCSLYQVGGPACGPGVGGGGVGGGCGSNDRGSCCSSADCPTRRLCAVSTDIVNVPPTRLVVLLVVQGLVANSTNLPPSREGQVDTAK